jgi:hypothetical protein
MLARVVEARRRAEASAVTAGLAQADAEAQTARLLFSQARSALADDPATALAWLDRLLASPAADAVDLEAVRLLVADAQARGVVRHAIVEGAREIVDLEATADGRHLIGRSIGGRVAIWDATSGRLRAELPGPFRDVAAAVRADRLAAVDDAGVSVWDLDGRLARREATTAPLAAVGFTGDDELVRVGADGAAEVAGARLVLELPITAAVGTAGGRVAVAGTGVIALWDPTTGELSRHGLEPGPLQHLRVSAAGDQLAVTSGPIATRFELTADGLVTGDAREAVQVDFDEDLVAFSTRTGIEVHDRTTGHVGELPSPENARIAFAGGRLAAANDQSRLFLYDRLPVRPSRVWRRSAPVRFVRATGSGPTAFFTSAGEIGLVETDTLRSLAADQRFYGGALVAMAAVGQRLVFGGDHTWMADAATGAVTMLWPAAIGCVAALPSGEGVVISADGELRVYDSSLAEIRATWSTGTTPRDCAARSDGTLVVSSGAGVVSILDLSTRTELARDTSPSGAAADGLAVLADGTVITGDFRGEVRAWRPGAPGRLLFRHDSIVWSVAASPDGRLIASAGRDRTIRISTADGRIVQILRGHRDEVSHVAFAPAGDVVIASCMDGTIARWPIDESLAPPATRAELARHLRELTSVVLPQDY